MLNENDVVSAVVSPPRSKASRAVALAGVWPSCALWIPAIIATLYFKWHYLTTGGFRSVGQLLGRSGVAGASDPYTGFLTTTEILGFFRWDLLLCCIALPAVASLPLGRCSPRWRVRLTAMASLGVIAFLAIQMRGYWMVGQFQSWELWADAIRWGIEHTGDAVAYGVLAMASKIAGAAAFLACCAYAANRLAAHHPRWLCFPSSLAAAGLLLLTAVAWICPLRATAFHAPLLQLCCRALVGASDSGNLARYSELDTQQAMQEWRRLSGTPAYTRDVSYFGAARDYDVIFFVLETAPADCLDLTGPLPDLPNLRALRQHSWVGVNHLSTYPFTRMALFSMLTSWYPTDFSYLYNTPERPLPSLMHTLANRGYATCAYKPYPDSRIDEDLQHREGIEVIRHARQLPSEDVAYKPAHWREVAALDHAALDQLKADIGRYALTKTSYSALFLPQIGHAPWADVVDDGQPRSIRQRGHDIIALQDRWLGELIECLDRSGRLDRTMIVVVGDHGIRTRMEDPDFVGGRLSAYSMHVPLLLYVPGVLQQPQYIQWPTSHIDIGPSVRHLLGITEGSDLQLGVPIWDQRLTGRTVYLWAERYLGADGFVQDQQYFMWHRVSDCLYASRQFDFAGVSPLLPNCPEAKTARENILDAIALQYHLIHSSHRPRTLMAANPLE